MTPKTPNKHIALVGLSGSGKSTIGPLLAKKLRMPFVDTDRQIERNVGMPVSRIFSEHGEAEFRRLEALEVDRVLQPPLKVISLGGGAVVNPESRERIWERSTVVWLEASPEALAHRLRRHTSNEERPLLSSGDPEQRLAKLLAERERYYSHAHVSVDTEQRDPYDVLAELLRLLKSMW